MAIGEAAPFLGFGFFPGGAQHIAKRCIVAPSSPFPLRNNSAGMGITLLLAGCLAYGGDPACRLVDSCSGKIFITFLLSSAGVSSFFGSSTVAT